jgi:hypothetical protein
MNFLETSENMEPLDIAEQIAINREWAHERSDEYNLVINKVGTWTMYKILVEDNEDRLRFRCAFDFACPMFAKFEVYRLLNMLNQSISPGAVCYNGDSEYLEYHSDLDFSDMRPVSSEEIERSISGMVDVLEQFYPCFQSIAAIDFKADEGAGHAMTADEALKQLMPQIQGRS